MSDETPKPKTITLSAEWLAAFERLAAHHGVSVDELVRRADLLPFRRHDFNCIKCGRLFHHFGRYPALAVREESDPFAVAHGLRIFATGQVEVYSHDHGGAVGTICPGCSKMFMEPIGRVLSFVQPAEADAIKSMGGAGSKAMDFVALMLGGGIGKKAPPPTVFDDGPAIGEERRPLRLTDGGLPEAVDDHLKHEPPQDPER